MAQTLPTSYDFDPDDPRAPALDQWERMSPEERARVVAMLPPDLPLDLLPNEGDPHRLAKRGALDALDGYFRGTGRRMYLSSELAVFYPSERRFAPDLIAVADVDLHERTSWIVADERRGLDFVLEVHAAGARRKDAKTNVERYARLGIPEYFYFDRTRLRLSGYRLPQGSLRAYERIVPQNGRFASAVLGLDLALEGKQLRFFAGTALLEDAGERIARLGSMLDKVIAGQEELAAKLAETEQQLAEERHDRAARETTLRSLGSAVKAALVKEGWAITHDPDTLPSGRRNLYVDLGAEPLLGAERRGETIAVEITCFLQESKVADVEDALGQFVLYRAALRRHDPARRLLLAVPLDAFESVWSDDVGRAVMEDEKVSLLVYDPTEEVIKRWMP